MAERWDDWFDEGENLLWQGRPENVRHWGVGLLISVLGGPFLLAGLFVAANGLRMLGAADAMGEYAFGVFLTLFSLPFISVGFGMVFGIWILDYLTPKHTRYALTNKAGYVATSFWNRKMDVFPIMPDIRVELIENRRGTSTIFFHFEEKLDSDGDQLTSKKGFTDIADGKEVYRIVRGLQGRKD